MSVIVHRNGTLAADSHVNCETMHSNSQCDLAYPYNKLWRLSSSLAGAVGPLQAVAAFQQWTLQGCTPEEFPLNTGGTLLLLTKEKGLLRYKDLPIPYLHGANNYAIGEGAPFAYGAMFMGATAEEAVAAAIDGSPHCNGHVVSLSL